MKRSVNFNPMLINREISAVNNFLSREENPEKRIGAVKWSLMNVLFDQFEDVERKNFHEAESEKFFLKIVSKIAKAKIERKKGIILKDGFDLNEIKFKDKNSQQVIKKENIDNFLLSKSCSEYYHGLSSIERILHERKIGILYMTIIKLLERRDKLNIVIDTNGKSTTIIIDW